MGEGGFLSLINATPYIWHNVYQHQYQLNSWSFPQVINPGELAQVYVELGSGIKVDDAGEVNYTVTDNSKTAFQIQLRVDKDVTTSSVYLASISTSVSHVGDTIPIGFTHNIATPWILSGTEGDFQTNALPVDWMQSNLASLGCQPLRHVCMPASHDAGMSVLNMHTIGSNKPDTVTQNLDIAGQLLYGARYFDIRPVITKGQFATGHYSKHGTYQGGNGQYIDEIINQINGFLAQNRELVILDLSHTFDTDNGYHRFTQDQWNKLMNQLSGLNNRFVAPANTRDLSTLKLRDFIAAGPAVLLIIDDSLPSGAEVDLGTFAGHGFYYSTQFPVYNNYSDTDKSDSMIADQIQKLKANRPNPDAGLFLLSWTLTQQGGTSFGIVGKSIIDLAQQVFPRLFNSNSLWDNLTKNTYPNFIMIDAWPEDRRLTALVVAINKYFASGC